MILTTFKQVQCVAIFVLSVKAMILDASAFNIDPIDLRGAVIVSPYAGAKTPEGEAVTMLQEEIERR
ncbi:MAG: hypothetical protein ABIH23_29755, partial [bacterium]